MRINSLLCPRCKRHLKRRPRHSKQGAFLGNRISCRCGLVADEVANDQVWKLVQRRRQKRFIRLKDLAATFADFLEKELASLADEETHFRFSNVAGPIRLLAFRSLTKRYHLSIREFAKVLVTVRPMWPNPGPLQTKFGYSMAQLTGPAMMSKLTDRIKKELGPSSNAWKEEERIRQVAVSTAESGSYKDRQAELDRVRRILQREVKSGHQYRGNPWS